MSLFSLFFCSSDNRSLKTMEDIQEVNCRLLAKLNNKRPHSAALIGLIESRNRKFEKLIATFDTVESQQPYIDSFYHFVTNLEDLFNTSTNIDIEQFKKRYFSSDNYRYVGEDKASSHSFSDTVLKGIFWSSIALLLSSVILFPFCWPAGAAALGVALLIAVPTGFYLSFSVKQNEYLVKEEEEAIFDQIDRLNLIQPEGEPTFAPTEF